ncbi:MAG TPA: agmatinase [Hyphomicrobiaceae bacterium]|nr:agmatinase [Hyphomicrobiaceae bacterium]
MTTAFDYLPPERSFLDPVRVDARDPAAARAVVIPFGLEASVSYGAGTAKGPAAILAASQQLELYDEELGREPYRDWGVAALAEPTIAQGVAPALDQLAAIVAKVLDGGRFPFILGGEHSLTAGAVRPFATRHPGLVVLQFDAHADLRDGYLGEPYSHAAAMRRVLDLAGVSIVSVGIRAISAEEAAFYAANRDRITIHWAKDQARWNIDEIIAPLRGRPVYVTFDIDALDGAVMPATGTPTPGGLGYWQALSILRAACGAAGQVVGADLVEFAPIPGFHAYDYTAAALAYKLLAYALMNPGRS